MLLLRENSHFFAITWIRFIGSRQNLAWIYYLTLGTSLRKNFTFFLKSKMAAGGQKFATRYTYECFCNNLDPVHRIQTKFGMDILLDHRNKLMEDFFNFLKIQDGRRRSKIEFRYNFGSKFTFRLGKWIPFIRFGIIFVLSQNPRWPPRPPLRQNIKSVIT